MQLSTKDAKEYEFTGEFRYPKVEEEFFGHDNKVCMASFDFAEERMPIVRKKAIAQAELPPTDIPKGYELTGEKRCPLAGESYYAPDCNPKVDTTCFDFEYQTAWILRKKDNAEKSKKSFISGVVIMRELTSKKDTDDRIGYLYDLVKDNKIAKLQFIQALGVVTLLEEAV